mmetsp:Transcript_5647/g.8674  ORF Transcript_5647/g.8674 Transcript_5647/m.8674 type:complete len:203 (-) Transcript_5647:391-999(-)
MLRLHCEAVLVGFCGLFLRQPLGFLSWRQPSIVRCIPVRYGTLHGNVRVTYPKKPLICSSLFRLRFSLSFLIIVNTSFMRSSVLFHFFSEMVTITLSLTVLTTPPIQAPGDWELSLLFLGASCKPKKFKILATRRLACQASLELGPLGQKSSTKLTKSLAIFPSLFEPLRPMGEKGCNLTDLDNLIKPRPSRRHYLCHPDSP